MLLAVVSPEIRCEWRLEDWQVALVSTVRNLSNQGTLCSFIDILFITKYLVIFCVCFRWCFWVSWSVGFSRVILPTNTDAGRSDSVVILDPQIVMWFQDKLDGKQFVCLCAQVVFGGFVWASYFSLLTSFSPTYGWFIFLRCMVGCGVAATSQG